MTGLWDALQYAILPVFAFPAIGWALGRAGQFSAEAARGANAYVVAFALPAMLLEMLRSADLGALDAGLVAVYLGVELTAYAAVYAAMRGLFRRRRREALLIAMTAAFPNHVFLALPIAGAVYGPVGAETVAALIAVDVPVIFGGTVLLLEMIRGEARLRDVVVDIASNRLLWAIGGGVAWSLSGLGAHEGLARFLGLAGATATPTALFALGVILSGVSLRAAGAAEALAVAVSLVAMPLAGAALGNMLASPGIPLQSAVMTLAAPCGVMAFVLGLRYNVEVGTVIRAILISTPLSILGFAVLA